MDSGVAAATRLAAVEGIAAAVVERRSVVVAAVVTGVVGIAAAVAAVVEADEALHELLTRHSHTIGNEIPLAHAGDRDVYHAR